MLSIKNQQDETRLDPNAHNQQQPSRHHRWSRY